MNKKEITIIKENYKMVYKNYISDKADVCRLNMKMLLDNLGLKKERYEVENEVTSYIEGFTIIQKEAFKMIVEDFNKYEIFVNYNLDDIENIFEELKYKMTNEEIKCYNARLNLIKQ